MARRRGQRSGHLYEKSGAWMLRWREDAKDAAGRPYRVRRTMKIADSEGPQSIGKREAERLAWNLVLSRLDEISLVPGTMITLADFVEQRFNPDHVWNCKPSGQAHYGYMLAHVLPALGRTRLRDITPIEVQKFLTRKRAEGYMVSLRKGKDVREVKKEFSAQTLRHMRNALGAVFEHARRLGIYPGENPAHLAMVPKGDVKEKRVLTDAEAAKLVAALPPGQYQTLGALLMTIGLRIGEAAALRWKRIDFTAGTITVAENYWKGKWTTPKTAKSWRTLPVPQQVLSQLAALRDGRENEDTVFVTGFGNPIDPDTTRTKILKPAGKRAGVPWVTWHSFRHSNASFTDGRLSDAQRQKLLGHSEARMTIHYTHPEMEKARAAVEAICDMLLLPDPNDSKGKVN